MSKINTGGSAFPVFQLEQCGEVVQEGSAGLTMRDYFAARALNGFLCSKYVFEFINEIGSFSTDADVRLNLATNSYLYADAMIKARGEQ